MPEFSIIVPVYNCVEEFPACVSSILMQTDSDFELILVDDGGADNCAAFCDQFAQSDARIKVIHKENNGASSARNCGLSYASGEYVLFFDGDDTVESDLLEYVSDVLKKEASQMVIFGMAFDYYNMEGELERTENLGIRHTGTISKEMLFSEFSEYFLDNALSSACNKAFSGKVLQERELRFSEGMTLYEDLDFVLRYLKHCEQISCLDRAFYHYRLSSQVSRINLRVMNLEMLQQNLLLLTRSALGLQSKEVSQRIADLCVQLFDQHLMIKDYSQEKLKCAVVQFRGCPALQLFSRHDILPLQNASASWPLIARKETLRLYGALQKRKWIRDTKRVIKPILKKVGILH